MSEEPNIKEHIVEIDDETATHYIEAELGQPLKSVKWFKTGYYSRAGLAQTEDGQKHVVRFGLEPSGYQKDKFASEHFSSSEVPVPKIKLIKKLENSLWLCLSDYADGVNSDELHGERAKTSIPGVQNTLVALHSTPVNAVDGYGEFDGDGRTTHKTWAEYLTNDFCSAEFYQDQAVETELIKEAWAKIGELAQLCPTERFLIHGDFGSDNLLVKNDKVAAVLDWYFAEVGDWAVDVAGCLKYPREVYGDLRAAHEKAGFDCSNWVTRINCYRLRSQIGLVDWFWDRQNRGLKNWQDIGGAQSNLRSGLERVKAGSTYGSS